MGIFDTFITIFYAFETHYFQTCGYDSCANLLVTSRYRSQNVQRKIVFKKDKAALHMISKRCEDTVIIPIKLEGNLLTLVYSKVCRLITSNLVGLTVNKPILRYLIPLIAEFI